MDQKEINRRNILIALFDGYEETGRIHPFNKEYGKTYKKPKNMGVKWVLLFRYNSSWDWIMPVVEKIEKLFDNGIDVNILSDGVVIQQLRDKIGQNLHNPVDIIRCTSAEISFSSKLESVFIAVSDFIELANKQEK